VEHFAAFSFVDRITELTPGTSVRGVFAVPAALPHFCSGLVAEAVGQLAAWAAMAQAEFRKRPVAALAADIRIMGEAAPGCRLDLGAEIDGGDRDTVLYGGWAQVGDARVMEMRQCLGPMLPMDDFDDPAAVRRHFETLRAAGARPGRFGGVAEPEIDIFERSAGQRLRATLRVPESAPFFADHFPRRPVYPATLLLDAETRLAAVLAQQVLHGPAKVHRVSGVKLRSFVVPGQVLEIGADTLSHASGSVRLGVTATAEGKRVATARVEMVAS